MSLSIGWRKALGKRVRLNVGKRGPSASVKLGPVTVSTRGRVSVRLAKGLTWRP